MIYFFATPTAHAAQTIDMTSLSNINIRIDGASANDKLGNYDFHANDLNQNDIPDLIITVPLGTYSGRTSVAITYIIYDNLISSLTGTGNTIDLSNSSNWNIRYVGTVTGDSASYYAVAASDLSGNGENDLIISHYAGDHGGTSNRGAVYYIKDDLLDDYTGTGNTVDLATTTNFTTKYIGASAGDYFGSSIGVDQDFDNDGKKDLFIVAAHASNNSRSNSGSAYMILNTLIDDYAGTGNIVSMGTSTNYNTRFDGASAGFELYSYLIPGDGDIDDDEKDDVFLSSPNASYSGTGSLYLIYNTILDDYTGTGNTLDLSQSSKYNVRINGATNDGYTLGFSVTNFVDLNNDSQNDLMIADSATSYNSKSYSGSIYVLYHSLLSSLTGTGNSLDLSSSSSYNLRIDGSDANSYFGYDNWAADYNADGLMDIIADNCCVENSVFIIYNSIFSSFTGTGNTLNLATSTNYSIRYTGPTNNQFDVIYTNVDLNSDGKVDIINNDALADNNSRANSGSNYIIYNFPHTVSQTTATRTDATATIVGSVSATNSTTSISGVQYQIDSNSPSGTWTSCTASDGSFNSTSESFTCTTSSAPTTDGTHTIYIRSYDSNTSYTAQSHYLSYAYTIGSSSPSSGNSSSSSSSTNFSPQIPQESSAVGVTAWATGDSFTAGQTVLTIIEPYTFNFNAFLSSIYVEPKSLFSGKNGFISFKSGKGTYWQIGKVQQIWYKAYPPLGSDKEPARIIPELQKKQSIVALSYSEADLIPPGKPKSKFNSKVLKIAFSVDGKTWKILPTSVVDTKNYTVAALHKIGGYYVIAGRL